MDYKKMIEAYANNGGSEEKMWESVAVTEMAMDYIKEADPDKYACLMRKLSESLYGKHYDEEMAHADVAKMHYIDRNGAEKHGAHWTVEEVETATAGKQFPKGTTKYDLFVAYNSQYADYCTKFTDEQILEGAYLFWFADKDWDGEGKIWDYMGLK